MTNETYAWQTADQVWFQIPLWEAILTGCLLQDEYITVTCVALVPLLVMVLGGLLSHIAYPPYVGHLLWTVNTFLFLTISPIIKWFKTSFEHDAKHAKTTPSIIENKIGEDV